MVAFYVSGLRLLYYRGEIQCIPATIGADQSAVLGQHLGSLIPYSGGSFATQRQNYAKL